MSKTPHHDLHTNLLIRRVKQLHRIIRLDLGDELALMVLSTPRFVREIREEDPTHVLEDNTELSELGMIVLKELSAQQVSRRLSAVVVKDDIELRLEVIENVAVKLDLGDLLFVGSDEKPTGAVLQSALCALFGAIHVRYGETDAKRLYKRLFGKRLSTLIVIIGNRHPAPEAPAIDLSVPFVLHQIKTFDWHNMKSALQWAYVVQMLLCLILITQSNHPMLMAIIVIPEIVITGLFVLIRMIKRPRHAFANWILFVFTLLSFSTAVNMMRTIKYGYVPVFTEQGLKAMDRYPGFKYRLMADIHLRDYRLQEDDPGDICFIEETIEAFDGNGHTIYNLQVPLFCRTKDVRNLWLRDVDFLESEYRGAGVDLSRSGPVARVNFGLMENVHVFGTIINVDEVGGLVGLNTGTIRLSSFEGDIFGNNQLGGLAFENGDTIEASYAAGRIHGKQYLGGLVAHNLGTIRDSFSDVEIIGELYIGGIFGHLSYFDSHDFLEGLLVYGSMEGESIGIIGPSEHFSTDAVYFAGTIVSRTYVPESYAYYGSMQSFAIPQGHAFLSPVYLRIIFFRDTLKLNYGVWNIYRDGNPEIRNNPYWTLKEGT